MDLNYNGVGIFNGHCLLQIREPTSQKTAVQCTASEFSPAVKACVCPRAINSSLVCPWFRPMCITYACHTLDTPKSAQRLITYAINHYFLTSIHAYLPRFSYFWKGELSIKFTCHYLVASTSFEYFSTDLKKAFRNEIYCLF